MNGLPRDREDATRWPEAGYTVLKLAPPERGDAPDARRLARNSGERVELSAAALSNQEVASPNPPLYMKRTPINVWSLARRSS